MTPQHTLWANDTAAANASMALTKSQSPLKFRVINDINAPKLLDGCKVGISKIPKNEIVDVWIERDYRFMDGDVSYIVYYGCGYYLVTEGARTQSKDKKLEPVNGETSPTKALPTTIGKYRFTKDSEITYIVTMVPPFPKTTKKYKKGDVVYGISYDNGKTISTLPNGSAPDGKVGVTYIPIPIENLELISNKQRSLNATNPVQSYPASYQLNAQLLYAIVGGISAGSYAWFMGKSTTKYAAFGAVAALGLSFVVPAIYYYLIVNKTGNKF